MSQTKRLIMITVPPPAVCDAINAVRRPLAALADSAVALSYPPHVTLRTGAVVPLDQLQPFVDGLQVLLQDVSPFILTAQGIHMGTYERDDGPQPIVAFKITPSHALLALNQRLLTYRQYRKSERTAFKPHLSIAYEDLSMANYEKLCAHIKTQPELQTRAFEWTCDNVSLYEKVDQRWVPYHVIQLHSGRC